MKATIAKIFLTFSLLLVLFAEAKSQLITDSVLIEGNYRVFHFYKPQPAAKNSSLIFVLHGSGGDGSNMMKPAAKLEQLSASENILLVYADGYKRYWNECRKSATSLANIENINEEAFFAAMYRYFQQHYGVNNQGFFVIGLSGGGHMGYKLAMTMPGQCRGISAVVANVPDTTNLDCTEAKKAVAVLISNGTKDELNPYTGGEMIMSGSSWGHVRSTERSFHYWASLAGYKGEPVIKMLPDADTTNAESIRQHTYRQKGKPEVTLLEVVGGVHAFPKDIDIFLESWEFFKREIKRR